MIKTITHYEVFGRKYDTLKEAEAALLQQSRYKHLNDLLRADLCLALNELPRADYTADLVLKFLVAKQDAIIDALATMPMTLGAPEVEPVPPPFTPK